MSLYFMQFCYFSCEIPLKGLLWNECKLRECSAFYLHPKSVSKRSSLFEGDLDCICFRKRDWLVLKASLMLFPWNEREKGSSFSCKWWLQLCCFWHVFPMILNLFSKFKARRNSQAISPSLDCKCSVFVHLFTPKSDFYWIVLHSWLPESMRRVGWRDNEIIETSHDIISIPLSLQKQRNSLDVQFVVKKTSQEGWSPTAIFTESESSSRVSFPKLPSSLQFYCRKISGPQTSSYKNMNRRWSSEITNGSLSTIEVSPSGMRDMSFFWYNRRVGTTKRGLIQYFEFRTSFRAVNLVLLFLESSFEGHIEGYIIYSQYKVITYSWSWREDSCFIRFGSFERTVWDRFVLRSFLVDNLGE